MWFGGFGGGLWWFGAKMAGQRNKNALKSVPQLSILTQTYSGC